MTFCLRNLCSMNEKRNCINLVTKYNKPNYT